ncbi:hypothetical protein PVAP13_7NG043089 [Panicum virgatum]|uniref:Uncharacterized protein n=1 Tax=Panicum virgatum TaxID=38727 RepID=A0A8T0Q473_PANVG|nr:hypothetical protein PVAP13_7NG043089 [Panicum virgatum]
MEPFKCDLCQGNGARDKSLENEMTLEIELLNDENDKLFKQLKQAKIDPKGQRSSIVLNVDNMVILVLNAKLNHSLTRFCGAKDKTRPEQIWVPSH